MKQTHCTFNCILIGVLSSLLVTGCATQKTAVDSEKHAAKLSTTMHSQKPLHYSARLFTPAAFIAHNDKKSMKAYVAMNLPLDPVSDIRKKLEAHLGSKLMTRDEAHITVISPPEYEKILKKRIGIAELSTMAEKGNLQKTAFKPLCIGKGTATLEGQEQATYYIVVDGEGLYNFRKEVQKLYVSRGGRALDFNPEFFFAHITLGFTKRDLHQEDGVTKDASTCILALTEGT